MKKKISIIMFITLILYIGINIYVNFVYGEDLNSMYTGLSNNPLTNPTSLIVSYIKWIGVAVCVGAIIYKGIKYVTVSPDGKADIKKDIIMITIGAILLFAGTSLIGMIYDMVQKSGLGA